MTRPVVTRLGLSPKTPAVQAGKSSFWTIWLFVILAATLLLTSISFAQAPRSKDTISAFGNWRIDLVRENRSLQLVGVVTEGKGAFFAIQCYAESDLLNIFVPTFDADEREVARKRGFVQVIAWNDQGPPITVPMVFFKDGAGIALADKRKLPDPFTIAAFNFLGKFREAKSFFAFEAGGATRTYDAKHLGAARAKFDQACADIRMSWDEFIRRSG